MPDRGLFYSAGGPTKRAFRLLTERTLADGAAARQLGHGRFPCAGPRRARGISGGSGSRPGARGASRDGAPVEDPEAGLHVKRDSRGRMKSACGYSVHAGVDEDGFIHRQTVTPGNVHDSREHDRLLLGDEAALYADAAYSSRATREALVRLGIAARVQLSEADKRRNAGIACGLEWNGPSPSTSGATLFASFIRRRGCRRVRSHFFPPQGGDREGGGSRFRNAAQFPLLHRFEKCGLASRER